VHSKRRFLPLLSLAALLLVSGCGGSDGPDTSKPDSTASISDKSPVSVLPGGAPVVVTAAIGPDSTQGKAALTFAEKIDPSNRDLSAELLKSFNESFDNVAVNYDADIKPWLGETGAVEIDSFDRDFSGVLAVQSTDTGKAQAFLDKGDQQSKSAKKTYAGANYAVDPDSGAADGLIGDFVVVASDEDHFKAAVDASKSGSVADDAKYKTAIGRLSDGDNLAVAYVDVDSLLTDLVKNGQLPQTTLDTFKKSPNYAAGETVAVSADVTDSAVTIESAGATGEIKSLAGAGDVGDLPGAAWLAMSVPVDGASLAPGFAQALVNAGSDPSVAQALDSFGVTDFVKALKGLSIRVGGDALTSINGSVKILADDETATKKVFDTVVQQAQTAAAGQIQINVSGSTATASAGPYSVKLTADGEGLSLALGKEPDTKLSDEDSFKSASDALDGETPLLFMDFAPLAALVKTIPNQNASDQQAQAVLDGLGTLILGSEVDGDVGRARFILTLK
jgi:hypothetical protein